ncbi:MAG: DUF5677 domain-containing protein [Syntrophobacteraceae bacterium]
MAESRFRDPEDIKKRVTGDIKKLNQRLLEIAVRLDKEARVHLITETLPGKILTSFYRKAVNTTKAIELLKKNMLIEEAWVLLRVLLEAHVNFCYFLRKSSEDPILICQRYADSSILEKLKHLREVNFYQGTDMAALHSPEKWEATETEIRARYNEKELKAMRHYGFSGLSFEGRAKAVGLKSMYEFCYRIASRSVHMFDPAETSTWTDYELSGLPFELPELLQSRREALESAQNMLLGRVSFVLAQMLQKHSFSAELMLVGLGYEKFIDRTAGPVRHDSEHKDDPPGSFYIWRE